MLSVRWVSLRRLLQPRIIQAASLATSNKSKFIIIEDRSATETEMSGV